MAPETVKSMCRKAIHFYSPPPYMASMLVPNGEIDWATVVVV